MLDTGAEDQSVMAGSPATAVVGASDSTINYSNGETLGGDLVPGSSDTTFTLALGDTVTGFVNTAKDSDWYAVQMTAGQTYAFGLTATSNGLDSYLQLYSNALGLQAIDDDSGGGTDSLLKYICTQTGTYYIAAKAFYGDGQSSYGGYSLTFNTTTPPHILDSIDWGTKLSSSTVLVYFASAGQTFAGTTSLGWNAYEKQQAMLALQQYANVANLTFVITTDSSLATFKLVTTNTTDFLGEFNPPGTTDAGVGIFARNGAGWDEQGGGGLEVGGQAFEVLVHEFGHGLGMAHPHDSGGTSEIMQRVTSEFNSYGLYGLNEGVYTTMSYNDGWALGPNGESNSNNFGAQAGPMALDIALIQSKYGANTNYNTGNNTYTLSGPGVAGGHYNAIWDAGGTDAIAFSGSADCVIDLRPATIDYTVTGGGMVSYVVGEIGGYTIAQGVNIEQALGGSGNDILTGSSADNLLSGGAGNDRLTGGGGSDTLNGGSGLDLAIYAGLAKSYTLHLTGAAGTVAGGPEGGTDTLSSIENLLFKDGVLTFDENNAAAVVMRMYDTVLHRAPDILGAQYWTHVYESGQITLNDLAISFANSTEFLNATAGMTNGQLANYMYVNTLHRAPDSQGLATWTAYLDQGHTVAQLVLQFSESSEHKALTAGTVAAGLWDGDASYQTALFMYEATFGRLPDQGGLDTWANALKGGLSLHDMAVAFTASGEFHNNTLGMNHVQLVDYMYQTALHRAPDQVGETSWTIFLDNGGSIADLVLQFEQSTELQTMNAQYIDHGDGWI